MKTVYNSEYRKNFNWYQENYVISTQYRKIKNTGKFNNTKIMWSYILNIILYSFFSIICVNLYTRYNISNWYMCFGTIIFIFLVFLYIISLIDLLYRYNILKKTLSDEKKKKGIFIINENGVEDKSEYCNISMKWVKINTVIITKYGIFILTDINIYFMLPPSIKDKLLKAINKYNNNKKLNIIIQENS